MLTLIPNRTPQTPIADQPIRTNDDIRRRELEPHRRALELRRDMVYRDSRAVLDSGDEF